MAAPDDTTRIDAVFARAREITDPAQRAAYLDQACAADKAMRAEIESLLAADQGAADFMNLETLPDAPPGAKSGERIGRYKLLERIGEGGFGEVWMAEQDQPVRRSVALKIIKLGMDTKEVVARFEAERQALALMEHPNIARMFDGGATETGRPYFVMELVRGIPITDYCDQNNLPASERLQLFIKVCQAVQHAHQKGIIHRDIKPSNVLVTLHDGESVPKVIDFGIAKALGQKLTEKTLFTAFRQMIGTPAYMSPEQAAMGDLDIDTRSDIYSLGVLLYELLTGVTPFDRDTLAKAALDEIRRMIRETEPLKPSTRLRTLGDKLTEVARHRHTEPMALSRLVRGDLDWIVMKCLEKDRARRYESASAFARDIEHYMKDQPVSAAAPTLSYRSLKFARRHRVALITTAGFAFVLSTATVVSTWEAVQATRAKEHQQTEAKRSRQVATFLEEMLNGVRPSVALGRDRTLLREILDKAAIRVGNELKGQPEVEAELRGIISRAYFELAEYPKAEAMMRETLAIEKRLHGENHVEVAKTLTKLAADLEPQGKLAEAEAMAREALRTEKRLLGNENLYVADALVTLGNVAWKQGKLAEAEAMHREALALQRKLLGGEHANIAQALLNLAAVLHDEGRLPEAEAMNRDALRIQRKLFGNEHPDVAWSLHNLATVLQDEGKLAPAEEMFRETLRMERKLLGAEHRNVAQSLDNLAIVINLQGRLAESEAMHREALAMKRKLLGNENPDVVASLINLANLLRDQGRLTESEAMHRETLAIERKLFGNEHIYIAGSLNNLALVLEDQGKMKEVEAMHREALAIGRKLLGDEHPIVAGFLESLANLLHDQDKLTQAEAMHREALAMRRKLLGNDHSDVADSLECLAKVLRSQGNLTEAESLAREGLAIRETKLPDQWPTFDAQSLIGYILVGEKKFAEAEPLLLSGYEGLRHRKDNLPQDGKRCFDEAGRRILELYKAWGKTDLEAEWKRKIEELKQAPSGTHD